jgi:hypothetical protein
MAQNHLWINQQASDEKRNLPGLTKSQLYDSHFDVPHINISNAYNKENNYMNGHQKSPIMAPNGLLEENI